ncbi:MAG: cusC 2 [Planctomycetaceae bacterium]|nr:cusC 2 [Planctomycetaceae bacterium]
MDGNRLAWMPVIALLLIVPSCRTPELRGPDVGRDSPDSFNGETSTENSGQLPFNEFFSDPLLTGLIDQGLAGNQQLKILGEEIQIANNEVLRRRGAYLPLVTLGTNAGLNKYSLYTLPGADNVQNTYPGGHHFPTPLPDFMVAANLSWQIDIWRQLRNARDAQSLRYLSTWEGRNYVVTRLVAEIAENYYSLIALDKRMENLDRTILLQQDSLEKAKAKKEFAQGTELAVQRFQAEVQKNQSEKLIITQEIIEVENRINFLVGRFPEPVQRSTEFFDLNLHALSVGIPADMLRNRPDIRQAERELEAAGLDVLVARANFYPKLVVTAGVGYEAFETRFLLQTPESLIYSVAGGLVAPLINKKAIQADYMNANARQLQAVYDYQRVVLNGFTEVVNRLSKVQNYTKSIEIKKQQLASLEASVNAATQLFVAGRIDYIDVLFAQRDLRDARIVLIDTKKEQLSAIVNTYQALGGGLIPFDYPNAGTIVPVGPVGPDLPVPAGLPVPAAAPEAGAAAQVPPALEVAPVPENGAEKK